MYDFPGDFHYETSPHFVQFDEGFQLLLKINPFPELRDHACDEDDTCFPQEEKPLAHFGRRCICRKHVPVTFAHPKRPSVFMEFHPPTGLSVYIPVAGFSGPVPAGQMAPLRFL